MKAKGKCRSGIPKKDFVTIAQQGLEWELRNKFKGMKFKDIYEIGVRASRYESLLRKEIDKKKSQFTELIIKKQ